MCGARASSGGKISAAVAPTPGPGDLYTATSPAPPASLNCQEVATFDLEKSNDTSKTHQPQQLSPHYHHLRASGSATAQHHQPSVAPLML